MIIEAPLAWTGTEFARDVQIEIDPATERITRVGPALGTATHAFPNGAILPGFVNAHSHAFQRGLRGEGETFPRGAGSFWTWREAMYDLVERMDDARLGRLARQAFREMRAAGMTSVGEFHYLHHPAPDDASFAFDDIMLDAARDVGIRIVLLQTLYLTGAIGEPLAGGQRHFDGRSFDHFVAQLDRLAARVDGTRQRVGVVAHSIRAVPIETMARLKTLADERGLVMHLHLEEQPAEIEACRVAYGATPMRVLLDHVNVDDRLTAVHCTHTAPDDMRAYRARGGRVCLCPLTEANLGDGIADLETACADGHAVSLGSDSNARISMLEEMRWLEYGQRLRHLARGRLIDDAGRIDTFLLRCATTEGAAALGLDAGTIEAGRLGDLVVIDRGHPDLAEVAESALAAALICGADHGAIHATCVGGHWQIRESAAETASARISC